MKIPHKKAVVYLRVSTEEQLDNFSLKHRKKFAKKKLNDVGTLLKKYFVKKENQQKILLDDLCLLS